MTRLIALLCLFALPAASEELVAGLSQNRVAITSSFDGSEILIFGAVKRQAPIPQDDPLAIVVTVEGPEGPITVRKKERRAGIWVNSQSVEIGSAPSFYAVATSAPLPEALGLGEDLIHGITVNRAIQSVGLASGAGNSSEFIDALIRIRTGQNLYQTLENQVNFRDQTLFDTRVALPASLVEGAYNTRMFLTRAGEVIGQYETVINVQKVGLERYLYRLAYDHALLYGILSLVIAIAAGWGAAAVFRYLQGQS